MINLELVPWKPFGQLSTLRGEMDSLWNQFFNRTPFPGYVTQEWMPTVDVSETKDKLLVKAELPGVDKKDVKVSISGDLITIKGEKKKEEEEKDEHHYCIERYCGSFQRVVQLPANVKSDKVKATFDKGVLKVTLPKVDEAKQKEIDIESN